MNSNNRSPTKKSRKPAAPVLKFPLADWLISLSVAFFTFTAFLPVLANEFVDWDDYESLVNNPHYRGLGWSQLRWMFTTFHMGHYQPLSWVSFALDYLLWGLNPVGYHLTNLVLHTLNAVLLFFLAQALLERIFQPTDSSSRVAIAVSAGVAALLFSIHPLRVESVAWATERRDVLSGFFILLTLYAYVRAHANPASACRRAFLALSFFAFVFSLLAKATAITMPAILLLLDVYPLQRFEGSWRRWLNASNRKILWEKWPFLAFALVFAAVAALAQQSVGALRPVQQYFLTYRLAQAAYGIIFYPWKTLFPLNLSPLYELPYDFDSWMPLFLFCGALAAFVTFSLCWWRARLMPGLISWGFFLIASAPVLGIAQSGPQLVADRYSYVSCMSWAVLAGGGFLRVWPSSNATAARRLGFFATCAVTSLVLIALAILTNNQSKVWRDTRTLWHHVIAVQPRSSIAQYNVGHLHERDGNFPESIEYYRRAVALNPTYAEAHYNLARLLARQGAHEEAIDHYRQVLKFRPHDADAHNNLGLSLWLHGQSELALAQLRAALQVDPNYAKALFNMGRIYATEGDFDNAIAYYRKALALSPKESEIYLALGRALAHQGQAQSAIGYLQEAVKLKPDFADAYIALARSLAAQGKKDEAEQYYREALRVLKAKNQGAPAP